MCTGAYFGRVGEETGWLVLQRDHHSGTNDGEGELAARLCWGLDELSLDELVEWEYLRWTVEQYHRDIKQVLGADELQSRTWRDVTVVMLTQAFVATYRLETVRPTVALTPSRRLPDNWSGPHRSNVDGRA